MTFADKKRRKKSMGPYRSCASILAISNPSILILVWSCKSVCGLLSLYMGRMGQKNKITKNEMTCRVAARIKTHRLVYRVYRVAAQTKKKPNVYA